MLPAKRSSTRSFAWTKAWRSCTSLPCLLPTPYSLLTIGCCRDYNTRFSGITAENHATATLTLASVRDALDAIINSETIIIGHALDNDLKTLRMIHHRCVDTVVLFPHTAGPPYRRALRTLSVSCFSLTRTKVELICVQSQGVPWPDNPGRRGGGTQLN